MHFGKNGQRAIWPNRFTHISPLLALGLLLAWGGAGHPTAAQAGGKYDLGLTLGDNNTVGEAFQVDNLTVFPIYAIKQPDVGKFVTLEEAVRAGKAEVRELGAGDTAAHRGDNAQVNTLVIDNRGGTTILVLAGTVVVGGKQDRQVGQDFVIPPHKVVPIDAFCVEHGRWNAKREGKGTGGKFGSVPILANQKVRGAGQYKKDQSEVWAQVSKVNADNSKSASTGTLLASLDDKDVSKERKRIKGKVTKWLKDVPNGKKVVGLAYAVDGEVRGARWFINNSVLSKFRDTLLNTMATEALTAKSAAKSAGRKVVTKKAKAKSVQGFVTELRNSAVKEKKKTAGGNENRYRETDKGFSSDCVIDMDGEAMPVTSDFLYK